MSGCQRRPRVHIDGRLRVEIWGGYNSIGGNCIVVDDGSKRIMLDQGLNFTAYRKYYGGYIQPGGVPELRELGVIPPEEAYKGVDEIYISHLHLDHVGSLNIPLYKTVYKMINVYVPSTSALESLTRFWAFNWKQLLTPSRHDILKGIREDGVGKGVRALQVNHSAYPSYSLLVETVEGLLLYTGDIRVDGLHPLANTLEAYTQINDDVELMVMEATNFSGFTHGTTLDEVVAILERMLARYKRKSIFLSAHPLDMEAFIAVTRKLCEHGYNIVLVNPLYARLLDTMISLLPEEVRRTLPEYMYLSGSQSNVPLLKNLDYISLNEAKRQSTVYVLSYTAVNELKTLYKSGFEVEGSLYITLSSEPREEEGRILEARIGSWLHRFGMAPLRLHVSGHYYPYDIQVILETIKPRKLIIVHTKAVETVIRYIQKYFPSTQTVIPSRQE